ncbi:helix-turn-helix domain-containing protein [Gemmobacter sp.]|uniref:helix-turn-helix domain-containing protein n=1 Tax=Gemmobacter sp. TaxID=1898957 RepID=UPI002AFF0B5D|nr:helix-turn-helix domain-containing protein [Gemmobacter sp.]
MSVALLNRYLVKRSHLRILIDMAISMESATVSSAAGLTVGSVVYAKYGEASVAGFQAVPDLLLKYQSELGLSPTDLAVLLNVLMHWWYPEKKPFPRSTTIAKRMGVTPRTVQRSLQQLEELGLLVREKDPRGPTYLDPAPLVEKLGALAKKDADYQIRRRRRDGEEELGPNQHPLG